MDALVRLDAPGRQHGVIRLLRPGLDGMTDPWTRAELPACVLGRGDGPVVTIIGTGGSAAQHAIAALSRDLDPDLLQGSLRLVPSLTPPGVAADDPAAALGASRHALNPWLDGSDLVIELGHRAGAWAWCDTASIEVTGLARAAERQGSPAAEAALIAFGAAMSVRQSVALPDDVIGAPDLDLGCPDPSQRSGVVPAQHPPSGVLAERCRALGIDWLGTLGHHAPGHGVEALATGCRNVLVQAGVLAGPFALRASRQLLLDIQRDLLASSAPGLLELRTRPGADIVQGDIVARLLDPHAPQHAPRILRAQRSGCVVAVRHDGVVQPGQGIAIIADAMQG